MMKKLDILRCFVLCVTAFSIAQLSQAQSRIVNVSPGIGTLNDAIDGDTTATGERIDPENTVYQLQGGGLYELEGDLNNEGFPLYIRTNPADSERAQLRPFDDGGGADRAFNAEGDLRLEGVKVSNLDQNGVLQERIIRLRDNGIRLTLDNCWLEIDDQVGIRCDDPDTRIFISNSIISNIGQGDDPDNGRLIDDRGEDIDSLVIFNSVVYNITSRFLRDGGGIIDYAKVDQNTFVNSAQRGFDFGIAKEVYFTNNMIVNGSFEGIDIPANPGEESESFVSVDEFLPDPLSQILVISHNNSYTQSALTDLYPAGIGPVPLVNNEVTALVTSPGLLSTNTNEVVEFNDGPAPPVDYLNEFFNGDVANSPEFWDPTFATYDFTYSPLLDSYTGGDQGQPIGILFEADVPCENPYPQVDVNSITAETKPNGNIVWTWEPIPGQIGCRVNILVGSGPQQGTFIKLGSDVSTFVAPANQLVPLTTYSFRVQCGCSQQPFVVGQYTAFVPWFYNPGSAILESGSDKTVASDEIIYVENTENLWQSVPYTEGSVFGSWTHLQEATSITTAPNPSSGHTFVTLNAHEDIAQGRIEVFDTAGKLIGTLYSGAVPAQEELRLELDGSDLPEGIYLIRFISDTEVVTEKFILSR